MRFSPRRQPKPALSRATAQHKPPHTTGKDIPHPQRKRTKPAHSNAEFATRHHKSSVFLCVFKAFTYFCRDKQQIIMRKVIGIGETVLDIIFKNNKPIEAVPGGSTFNAIVSLARAGAAATLISEVGKDRVGDHVLRFLQDNGAQTEFIGRHTDARSPISLAFLDEQNEADYVFYSSPQHEEREAELPEIQPNDIILFGSYYAVSPKMRPQVARLLDYARQRGAIIYYDVNFRPNHKDEVIRITPNLLENLDYADIVRGSRADFLTLYKMDDADKVYNAEIAFHCKQFIHTDGANPVRLFTGNGLRKSYSIPPTDTTSTIGAGDNFNAGLIYGLLREGITREQISNGLSEAEWDKLVGYALQFSAECCKDIFNYVSKEFGKAMTLRP